MMLYMHGVMFCCGCVGPGGAPYGSPARARAQGGRAAGKVWPDRVWWSCLPIGWSGCVVAASARSSVQEVSQHQHSTCGKICHYSLIFLKQEGAHEFLEMIRAPSALEHLMDKELQAVCGQLRDIRNALTAESEEVRHKCDHMRSEALEDCAQRQVCVCVRAYTCNHNSLVHCAAWPLTMLLSDFTPHAATPPHTCSLCCLAPHHAAT
eukprot:1159489-Pelagomonas_calceolata.AAC.5